MNTRISRFVAALAFVFSLAGISQAQVVGLLTADVPFAFSVGKKTFPAGNYQVARDQEGRVSLRDPRGHVLVTVMSVPVAAVSAPVATKLVFQANGGGYALSQVWVANDRYGEQLHRSKPAMSLAKQNVSPEISVIAGRE
jgi:hypothetical protein